jgi:hypothetical protein
MQFPRLPVKFPRSPFYSCTKSGNSSILPVTLRRNIRRIDMYYVNE